MTDADVAVNPQHCASDPTKTWIQIRISLEIGIRIQDHFRLTLRPWWSLRSVSALVLTVKCFIVPAKRSACIFSSMNE